MAIVRLWLMPLPSSLWTDEANEVFLVRYPVLGRVYPFPFKPSPDAKWFAAALARSALRTSNRFFVYGHRSNAYFWENWFMRRPELAGWSDRRLGPFGEVVVVEFDRPKGK